MRGYIIGAATARLMAPNPPPSVYETSANWAKTVYLLTSEGKTEGNLIPAQCADTTLETGHNGVFGVRLRAAKKLPWANFSISNEGGTGSRIQFADAGGALLLGAGAFTLEGWVACNGATRHAELFRRGVGSSYGFAFGTEGAGNRLYFSWSTDGSTVNTLWSSGAGSTITNDLLHHVRVDRTEAGVLRIYLDGKMVAKQTVTDTIFANAGQAVWMTATSAGHGSIMYFDDLRATVGVARCGSDSGYEVPGARAPKGPNGDPYWENVATYNRFQSDNVAQSYLDCAPYGFFTDNSGNFQSQAAGKFGSGNYSTYFMQHPLVYLNSSVRNAVMNLRGKDFTIEFQIQPGDTDNTGVLMGSWESAKMQWRVRLAGGYVALATSSSGTGETKSIISSAKLNNGAFNSVVIERAGTTVKIFINGVQRGGGALTSADLFDSGASPQFTPFGVGDGGPPHATLDEMRITVGVARYADAGETPTIQTAQFPAYKGAGGAPADVLLDEQGNPLRAEDGQFLTEG